MTASDLSSSKSALLPFFALALIWGTSFLLTKIAVGGIEPNLLVLLRLVCGAAVLLVVMRVIKLRLPTDAVLWGHLALSSCLLYVAPQLLFAWALKRVDSHVAGLFNATIPLASLAFALAVGVHKKTEPRLIAGLVLGGLGAVLVIAPWKAQNSSELVGQLACLAAALTSACAGVYMSRFGRDDGLNSISRGASQLIAGAAITAVVVAVAPPDDIELTWPVAFSALVLGVIGSGGAAVLYWRVVSSLGVVRASMVSYVTPLIAVVAGVLVANERLTLHAAVGGVLIILGVAAAQDLSRVFRTRQPRT